MVKAALLTALFLLCAGQAVIMTGTKSNGTFVTVSPGPGTPRPTTATTRTTAARTGPAAAATAATAAPTARK